MPMINIAGLDVDFPFEPYEIQVKYMTSVVESLNQKRHAVLESPTGTGKTLSLLCSSLAWVCRENRKGNTNSNQNALSGEELSFIPRFSKIRVIYASKTHSQLSKAMAEFRTTAYKHMSSTVLGSRNQMCIHPETPENNNALKNTFCKAHVRANTCHFYRKVDGAKEDPRFREVIDLEDLISKSRAASCCPFYLTRSLQDYVDVIFMPYNYLFDRQMAKRLGIHVENSVIILDEAHNVDKVCEDSSSVSLSSTDIAVAIKDIRKEMKDMYDELKGIGLNETMIERNYSSEDLVFVIEKLTALEAEFEVLEADPKNIEFAFNGSFILKFLAKCDIQPADCRRFVEILDNVCETITAKNTVVRSSRLGSTTITSITDFITMVFSIDGASIDRYFKVYVKKEKVSEWGSETADKGIEVNFWCFFPGHGMKALADCHSIILTSGTLSPLSATISELGLEKPVTGEFHHIVSKDQYLVFSLLRGPNNVEFSTSFANRENMTMWRETGLALQNFIRLIPDGVLVFFPSYAVLRKAIESWESVGLLAKLKTYKPVFIEGSDRRQHAAMMLDYKKSVEDGNGGVLIGVCRGKISEGLDFSDAMGRAVIVFGLPYPPVFDPKVKLKKEYLSRARLRDLSGEQWYQLEAIKAVNQAIGRVIRHRNDFGAIILCDTKFDYPNVLDCISQWLHPIRSTSSFGEAISLIARFFKPHKLVKTPKPAIASAASVEKKPRAISSLEIDSRDTSGSSKGLSPPKSRLSLIEALSKSEDHAVDEEFSSKPLPQVTSCKLFENVDSETTQPTKKRKITMAPVIPSDIALSGPSQPRPVEKRMKDLKKLFCQMKTLLENESYGRFLFLIKEFYAKTLEIDQFIRELAVLFPATDPDFKQIFLDCRMMFSGEALEKFIKYCETHYV